MAGESSNSGGVLKNRSSSGCLVLKTKLDGVGGAGTSGGRKVYESKKAKKRARVSAGDSVSSDEELLEYYRRQGGALGSGSVGYNDFGDVGFGRNGLMREGGMKRSKLDVYDFDEYDDLSDVEMMGGRSFYEREMSGGSERRLYSTKMEVKSGSGMEFETGSTKGDIIYKRRNSFHGSTNEDYYSGKRRYEMKNELPITMGKEIFGGSDEAIRLQGKNGVLKVRVKNEQRPQSYRSMEGNNLICRGQELTAKSIIIQRHSPYSEKKLPKKPLTAGRIDKKPIDKRKSFSAKSSEESDEESEDDDSSLKFQSDNVKVRQPFKRGRRAGSLQSPERSQPTKIREGKVKRGSGTEKQLLREKIKSMLIGAGWTIDYRPRRGRDYSDAVYVNPTGTAFWSIIKAYDALQKQLEEDGKCLKVSDDSSSFAPISEDTLSKLTRQTRKKIEKELKRKKREESGAKKKHFIRNFEEDESDADSAGSGRPDEKLSSYMKRSGKLLKCSSKDVWREVSSSSSKMPERGEKSCSMSSSRFIHARKSNKIGRCTLLVRSSEKGHDSGTDGFVPYTGKRNLLSWLIDSGTVELSEKVHYMNRRRTRVMLEGWITKDGIHCGCCSKILSVSKFEIHAASKLRQPFQNIYLSTGPSLLECQVDTWNKQDESLRNGFNKINVEGDDPNDDTCAMCGDGGNLICCDSCPSTFHQNCLDIQMLPPGDWHCPHCSCKFCGLANVGVSEGYDTKEDILFTCSLCERKYHCSCVEMDVSPIISNSPLPFCGRNCSELFEKLQKLLGVKHELEGGLCWSLIHRTDLASDNSVRSLPQRVEWNSKLAVALSIMNECFLPITDRRSGINMIHNVFYNCGSNFTRLNYSGFFTAVLERSDEIISAASIRIHGTQFAEMPFIGTRHIYRRQGMCRQLFSAIESALCSLNVEKLIIPAISELMDTWTGVFGFSSLEESDKREMKSVNMLVFPGTDMLQKKLLDRNGYEKDLGGVVSFDAGHNASDAADLTQTSDFDSSPGPCIVHASQDGEKISDKCIVDRSGQDIAVSMGGISIKSPQHVCEEFKPATDTISPDIYNEAKQAFRGEESQGTKNSPLQLDTMLKETAKYFNEPTPSSMNEDVGNTLNALDSSAENHEVSVDCRLTEGACKTDTEITSNGLPKSYKIHREMSDNNIPRSGKSQNDDSLCPDVLSVGGKDQSIPAAPHDCVSSSKAMPVVPDTGSQGGTNSPLQLDIDLRDSAEDLKDRIPSHTREDNVVTESALDDSAENFEVSTGSKLTHEACKNDTEIVDIGSLRNDKAQNDDSLSLNVVTESALDDSAENFELSTGSKLMQEACKTDTEIVDIGIHKAQNNDSLSLNTGSAAGREQRSLSETPQDDILTDKYAVDEDKIGDTTELNVDNAHTVPGITIDAFSELQSLNVPDTTFFGASRELKSPFCANDEGCSPSEQSSILGGDGTCRSPQNKIYDTIVEVEPELYSTRKDTNATEKALDDSAEKHGVSAESKLTHEACKTDTEITVSGSPRNDKAQNDDSLSLKAGSAAGGEHQSLSETSQDEILTEKAAVVVDKIGDTTGAKIDDAHRVPDFAVDASSELQSLNVSDTTVFAAFHETTSHVCENDEGCSPSEQLLISSEDGTCSSPQNKIYGTIGAVKPKLVPCDGVVVQPILEGEMKIVGNIITEVADVQSVSRLTTEISTDNAEAAFHSCVHNHSPVSADCSASHLLITGAAVLPVCGYEEQSPSDEKSR